MLHKTLIERRGEKAVEEEEEEEEEEGRKWKKSKTWNPFTFTGFRSVPIISEHNVSNWPPVKRNQRSLQPGHNSQLERAIE